MHRLLHLDHTGFLFPYDARVSIRDPGPGRSSDVIDAILGKVADNRSRTDTTNALFRAKALDQLDVSADIDNQLPLVSRRNWLLLVGAALIVIAFVAWAALTPATQAVSGAGRVLAPSGLLSVTSPDSGIIVELNATSGDVIGFDIPESVQVVLHEESLTQIHLTIPATETLTDADLEPVAGGVDWSGSTSRDGISTCG